MEKNIEIWLYSHEVTEKTKLLMQLRNIEAFFLKQNITPVIFCEHGVAGHEFFPYLRYQVEYNQYLRPTRDHLSRSSASLFLHVLKNRIKSGKSEFVVIANKNALDDFISSIQSLVFFKEAESKVVAEDELMTRLNIKFLLL